ncbi:MAG: hypothetical protein ACO1OX_07775 [Novosphingobium sp.]
METSIGKFNPATGTVPVLFTHEGVKHRRAVNACLDDHGNYDRAATRARVAEVALGVANKIAAGRLT